MAIELDRTSLLVPLVIGVTGHRNLRSGDIEVLKAKVRQVFAELRHQYPNTPFLLLSPLAEGADRLVARVALEAESNARLVVPLPMPRHLFETDFQKPESLQEFRELLDRADHWFELPLLNAADAAKNAGDARDRQYESGGMFIARESQILIALWDGFPSGKVGGTAAIVDFQTKGPPDRGATDLLPPELFPAYHIVTPRQGQPLPKDAFDLKKIFPSNAESYYAKVFGNLDQFNECIRRGGEPLNKQIGPSLRDLVSESIEDRLSYSEALTAHRYAVADALAITFQRKADQVDLLLHAIVFFWFLSFVMFAHLEAHPALLLIISLGLAALGAWLYRRAKSSKLDDKRQDYRALAEGCRVRFFWQIAGIDQSVADHYLGRQRTELDWIRNALRGWRTEVDQQNRGSLSPQEQVELIRRKWIAGQRGYFRDKAAQNLKDGEAKEKLVQASLWLALATALGVLFLAVCGQIEASSWWKCPECESWLGWPVILIDAFLALGALIHHYNHRKAHIEQYKQYKRMKGIFESAALFTEKADLATARPCLVQLGREALAEHGDWVLLHRERPMELPHP